MTEKAPASVVLTIRVSTEEAAVLDAIAGKLPGSTRSAVAREAVRRGLPSLQQDFLSVPEAKPAPTRRRKSADKA